VTVEVKRDAIACEEGRRLVQACRRGIPCLFYCISQTDP